MPKILSLGGFNGGTVPNNTTFSGNVVIQGTLDVTGVATFTTTVTGSGNIMAGAAFALGFTGRGQFKSGADGIIGAYATNGTAGSTIAIASDKGIQFSSTTAPEGAAGNCFYPSTAGYLGVGASIGGAAYLLLGSAGILLQNGKVLTFTSGAAGSTETYLYQKSATILAVSGNGTTTAGGFQPAQSANGATLQILSVSENLTLSTSGATTDTTANLLVAGSIVLTVVAHVTTTITTATDWAVGDPTTALRFIPANATMTAGTTDIGRTHLTTGIASATTGIYQSANAKVRVTTTGTPGAGAIRLTTFYILLTPPTS